MKILAIDPGYERLGVCVLEKNKNQKEKLLYSDTFKTDAKLEFTQRLFLIGQELERIIEEYKPKALSIEKLFFNTNQKTATNVSETRGAVIYICLKNKMKVFQYTPLEIKTAITGYGRSEKKQVLFMLKQLIEIKKEIKYDDEYDAIACGLTFFAYNQNLDKI